MVDTPKPEVEPVVAAQPQALAASAPEAAPAAPPVAAAPVESIAPVVEPAAKEPLVSERPSLLEAFKDKPAEAKPAEAAPAADAPKDPVVEAKPAEPAKAAEPPKAEEDKPAEAKPAEAAPAEPVKYEWELPPELKADEARIGALNEILNEAKLPADIGKQAGQKLLSLHTEAMATYADHLAQEQHKSFNDTRSQWNKDVLADEQIGGAGHETAMRAIARMRDRFLSDAAPDSPAYAKDAAEFDQFLRITGAGDHPIYLKMLHRVSAYFDEPQAKDMPTGITPPRGNGKRPNGGIYTHPSSANMDK